MGCRYMAYFLQLGGLSESSSFDATVLLSFLMLIGNMAGWIFVERFGRRNTALYGNSPPLTLLLHQLTKHRLHNPRLSPLPHRHLGRNPLQKCHLGASSLHGHLVLHLPIHHRLRGLAHRHRSLQVLLTGPHTIPGNRDTGARWCDFRHFLTLHGEPRPGEYGRESGVYLWGNFGG